MYFSMGAIYIVNRVRIIVCILQICTVFRRSLFIYITRTLTKSDFCIFQAFLAGPNTCLTVSGGTRHRMFENCSTNAILYTFLKRYNRKCRKGRSGFTVLRGPGAVTMWRPLSVTTNLSYNFFLFHATNRKVAGSIPDKVTEFFS
jgi:hypothetical protein